MAEQKFVNLGPIYTTAEKYEALRQAGTLEIGREYKIVDWEAQEKLIAGDNITIAADGKTISATDTIYNDTEVRALITSEEQARISADSELNTNKLTILPTVDDPSDPGYGYPYWIPYSFATDTKSEGLDIILKTLTLDNTLRKMNFTNSFPVASSSEAGIMTATDKIKLDSAVQPTVVKTINGESLLDNNSNASDITLVKPEELNGLASEGWVQNYAAPWLGDKGKIPEWKTEDPGAGYAIHIPYRFGFTPDANKLDVKIYTITADGNNTYDEWDNTLPPANAIEAMSYQNAGLMTSADATAVRTTYPAAIAAKQDTLVSGSNIKTINGNSLLGEGNISVRTYQAFPDEFVTDGTVQEFVDSVFNTPGVDVGMGYLGELYCSDLPITPEGSFSNVEATVVIVTYGILVIEFTTGSNGYTPYMWKYNSALGRWVKWSDVSVSNTGTATDEIKYITVDGVEKKIHQPVPELPDDASTSTYVLKAVNGTIQWVKQS